jgi:putative FmdB family regulatory protein
MPIYAYKCESCGHRQDVLQKISDPVLTTCPACGAAAFVKQVTAAGFQLKGSGWYVTDFRDGGAKAKAGATGDAKSDSQVDAKADGAGAPPAESKAPDKAAGTSVSAPAPAPTPTPGAGT